MIFRFDNARARERERITRRVNEFGLEADQRSESAGSRFSVKILKGIVLRDLGGDENPAKRICAKRVGGGRRTRTFEVIRRLIYS
jgi:hypothetical protein